MENENLPFGLSWKQIYLGLILINGMMILLFILFTKYFS